MSLTKMWWNRDIIPPIYNAPDGLRLSMSKIDHLQIESRNPSF